MAPTLASALSQLDAALAALALGLVVGIAGHVVRSRPLIVAGILIVGGVSVWFSFVARPS